MAYTLAKFLGQVFLKNKYSLLFIDNCFRTLVDKLFIKHPQLTKVVKKTLFCHYNTLEKFPCKQELSLENILGYHL